MRVPLPRALRTAAHSRLRRSWPLTARLRRDILNRGRVLNRRRVEEDDISVHFIAANAQVTDDLRKGEESRYRAFNRRQVLHRKRVLKERTFTQIYFKNGK